jgi:hypothetical protein
MAPHSPLIFSFFPFLSLDGLGAVHLKSLKCAGFSDRQIARYCNGTELVVRNYSVVHILYKHLTLRL